MSTTRRTANRRRKSDAVAVEEMGDVLYVLRHGHNLLDILPTDDGEIITAAARDVARGYWQRPDVQRAARIEGGDYWGRWAARVEDSGDDARGAGG